MTHPTDDELEAIAAGVLAQTSWGVPLDAEFAQKTAATLRACKGQGATAFETGLNEALKVIASIGYGKNQDVDEGHEEAYRAVETYLKDWKANKPADLDLAPDQSDWNAAIEAAIVNLKVYAPHQDHAGPEHDIGYAAGYHTALNRVSALKKGSPQ